MQSAIDVDGDVLSQLVPSGEDDDDVDLELDLELLMFASRGAEGLREEHIGRDLNVLQAVSVGHLDVLHLSSILLVLEGLASNQLDLETLDRVL